MYHIVFICDENYFIPTKAAINSVIRNKNTEDKLHIAVIGVGLGKKHVEAFDKYQSASVQIEVIIPKGALMR